MHCIGLLATSDRSIERDRSQPQPCMLSIADAAGRTVRCPSLADEATTLFVPNYYVILIFLRVKISHV